MRALVAIALVLALAISVAGAHVHVGAEAHGCAVCVLHHTDVPRSEAPDVAPVVQARGEVAAAPGLPPVTGAPLGAIPGQSPPGRA